MHRLIPIFLIQFLLPGEIRAQNMVVNPSFEVTNPGAIVVPCEFMQYSQYFGQNTADWSGFSDGTPDLLRSGNNCTWLPQAHNGEQCLGLITYLPADDVGQRADYHEYVQGRLSAPLKPGLKYRLECWVREDSAIVQAHFTKFYTAKTPVAPTRAGNLSFCFSVAPFRPHEISLSAIARSGLQPQVNFSDIIATNGQWVKLSVTFVPDRPFQHFTIGNFFADKLTFNDLQPETHKKIEKKNATLSSPVDKVKRVAYLCIDDVFIAPENPPPPPASLEQALLKDKKYTFSAGVLFDSGNDILRPEAGAELDSLTAFLQKFPGVVIGISGHTDDVGSEADNLDLSERRARSVQNCLAAKGIAADRLRSRGFGETRPVADNTTEAGRQANRRVECIVLKN